MTNASTADQALVPFDRVHRRLEDDAVSAPQRASEQGALKPSPPRKSVVTDVLR